jgi:hypothetical protein
MFAYTAIDVTVYRLQTKENKLPFSVFACSQQTEVAVFVSSVYDTFRVTKFIISKFMRNKKNIVACDIYLYSIEGLIVTIVTYKL